MFVDLRALLFRLQASSQIVTLRDIVGLGAMERCGEM